MNWSYLAHNISDLSDEKELSEVTIRLKDGSIAKVALTLEDGVPLLVEGDEQKATVRDTMIAFIKAANEEAIANPIGVPVIRVNQNPRPYPRLEFGSRFSIDQRKVLVWSDDRTHSEKTPEEAVDLYLGEK